MKTINYSVTKDDVKTLKEDYLNYMLKFEKQFNEHPEWYGGKKYEDLFGAWKVLTLNFVMFEQFNRDGIAQIQKQPDEFYTFEDHVGDSYNPEVNNDIDPKELKRQRRNELARCNRQGFHWMKLQVLGEYQDSIGGFCGDDFYGSGYDDDFYRTTIDVVKKELPEYFEELQNASLLLI